MLAAEGGLFGTVVVGLVYGQANLAFMAGGALAGVVGGHANGIQAAKEVATVRA